MDSVSSALYLDFDNVFSGLLDLDPDVAIQFADDPGRWLSRLTDTLLVDGRRRWLVRRCYMNPAGWVPHPNPQAGMPKLFFSRFRPAFTRAGFEVVDCPRLSSTKNGADIRMVLDVLDSLNGSMSYEEYVIASGDSDMTPLLVRLRAVDRRTTVISSFEAAAGYGAVADRFVAGSQILELVQDAPAEANPEDELPPEQALSVGSQSAPDATGPVGESASLPASMARVTTLLNLPRLRKEIWPAVYAILAEYSATHEFNLTEATKWSRDQLVERGTVASRGAVAFVCHATAHGGCPLYRQPSPTSDDIASATVDNVLRRADEAGLDLSETELNEIRLWMNYPSSPGTGENGILGH